VGNFSVHFCTRNFWGGNGFNRYAGIVLIVALSPGHNDVTKFRKWSPMATGNDLD
jgi:hypothetical protein